MSDYLTNTERQVKEMLDRIGVQSLDDLYDDIPVDLKVLKLDIDKGLSQQETFCRMKKMAQDNTAYDCIMRGAGAYDHYIPSVVKYLSSRSEFLTAYTPYQAEMSQGILQSIFEYQTMICSLTGMDVSNASVYSGATAAAEAVLMTKTNSKNEIVLSDNVNPANLSVIKTYISRRGMTIKMIPNKNGQTDMDALSAAITENTACVYLEQPNYFGLIEEHTKNIADVIHDKKGKFIMNCNPMTLALLKTPRECGADIAVGETQPFGMSLSFGGPYLGYMASTEAEMRKLPGRIVGETVDKEGNRAFVLTLQAREQHIRREKALSNICSNQAWCALVAGMYLTAMGSEGLKEVATSCLSLAHYAAEEFVKAGATLKYNKAPFFHEFVTVTKAKASKINERLKKEGILGGLELDKNEMLWCCTETVTKDQIDKATDIIRRA